MSNSFMAGKDIMQALVADFGSFSTKIGFAGDDHPQAVYSSTTAVERREWHRRDAPDSSSSSSPRTNFLHGPRRDFVTRCINGGNDDGKFELANPVDPVTGWIFCPPSRSCAGRTIASSSSNVAAVVAASSLSSNDRLGDEWESHELVSRYLQHAFHNALGLGGRDNNDDDNAAAIASHHPLLLLDKPHTPPALRQRMLEIMFETHNLPAVFFLRDAVASCYAVGRTTATVVDVGHTATMVSPVYEGFVESRGVLRNNACGARCIDERVLAMMDDVVKKQGGRRRKDRMRRMNQRRLEQKQQGAAAGAGASGSSNHASGMESHNNDSPSKQPPPTQRSSTTTLKRDAAGHFIKDSSNLALAPIPDYLMPLYQVRRAPTYNTRSDPFHNWARITLAREIKEMGLGVAVGPYGYVSSANTTNNTAGGSINGTAEGGASTMLPTPEGIHSVNPAMATNAFLTSSKSPYTLPDGTPVEITTASRCDIAELFFGSDEFNNNYRDNIFDETVQQMEKYENEIESFLAKSGDGDDEEMGGVELSSRMPTSVDNGEAGDAYSNTSYKGEKSSRHHFGMKRRTHYPPSTVSKKLYSACLPYIRTTPPNILSGDGMDAGGSGFSNISSGASGTGVNEKYFHYLTSAAPAQMVCDAAFRCDRDQQASLLGNVVVCGGGSCISGVAGVGAASGPLGVVGGPVPTGSGVSVIGGGGGGGGGVITSLLGDEQAFPDRLREEIEAIVHRHTPGWRVKVTSPNISERAICSWLGGSILGSLSTFQDMWISRKDYEEYGAAIVNRKCP